ncbi:MAG: 7-cyano-7-deazaguanine synthase QueC [Sulfurospirillum sp.]|nr:7-cyano-7-deazaguanine synthase QueC [Sulfurospirillum sp.]
MSNALVVFSGGQDSTTCLGWAKSRFEKVETLTFDYGQKHRVEIYQAKKIAQLLGIENFVLKFDAFSQLGDSALIDSGMDISSAHKHKPNLPASFVPNRNAVFFTLAHAYAQKQGINHIITGINQTDYSGYPDCRQNFIESLELALNLGSESIIKFHYPLIHLSKAQTFLLAKETGILDIVLQQSHTCYNGDHNTWNDWGYGCGICPACMLRAKGWQEYEEKFTK